MNRQNTWVRVNDRLPTESGDYLVYNCNTGYCTVIHYSVRHRAFNAHDFIDRAKFAISVTHWMSVPAAPLL